MTEYKPKSSEVTRVKNSRVIYVDSEYSNSISHNEVKLKFLREGANDWVIYGDYYVHYSNGKKHSEKHVNRTNDFLKRNASKLTDRAVSIILHDFRLDKTWSNKITYVS